MSGVSEPAKTRYRLKILPAGKNDRVVEISGSDGSPVKYVFCPHRLGKSSEDFLDIRMQKDWESMDADEFETKYSLLES
ncbi:MAG: hypothetical protein WC828_09420 [Thermoleophilia bacterium]|jgi:hypothetical protein